MLKIDSNAHLSLPKTGATEGMEGLGSQPGSDLTGAGTNADAGGSGSFLNMLQQSISEVGNYQVTADKAAADLATGKSENIHQTMLALSQAELSFNMMVQVRNKALEAYQEVMRMQV